MPAMSEYIGVYDDDDYDDTREAQAASLWDQFNAKTRILPVYRFGPGFQQTKLWVTREGKSMRLEDMTPSHRGNTIRMLERKVDGLPGLDWKELHETPLIKRLKELGTE